MLYKLLPFVVCYVVIWREMMSFDPPSWIHPLGFYYFQKCPEITGIKTKSSQNTYEMYKFVNFTSQVWWKIWQKLKSYVKISWFFAKPTWNLARWLATVTAKELTSRQKERDSRQKEKPHDKKKKSHGKKNNLTAKRITSRQEENDWRQEENLTAKRKRVTKKLLRCPEDILILISFAVRSRFFFLPWVLFFLPWGYSFCLEVFLFAVSLFLFAVRLFFLPWVYFFCLDSCRPP